MLGITAVNVWHRQTAQSPEKFITHLHHGRRETDARRTTAGCVLAPRGQPVDVGQQLGLGHPGVTHQTHVDVPSDLHSCQSKEEGGGLASARSLSWSQAVAGGVETQTEISSCYFCFLMNVRARTAVGLCVFTQPAAMVCSNLRHGVVFKNWRDWKVQKATKVDEHYVLLGRCFKITTALQHIITSRLQAMSSISFHCLRQPLALGLF